MKKQLIWAIASCAVTLGAHAGEIYGGAGLPGVMLGYAHTASERLVLRADLSTIGSVSRDRSESGIDYTGTAKLNRAGLFADWFPGSGGFRLTGGVTFNDMKIASPATATAAPSPSAATAT